MISHFNVNVRKPDNELRLSKENYLVVDNRSSLRSNFVYSDEWCEKQYEKCLINFDLNMNYFSSLDSNEFNKILNKFIKKIKFTEVSDLNDYAEKSGYYIMVLDEYKQIYIGTSDNIKRRIMSHWSKVKPFDRLIFGTVENSILSIDSFKVLDTTRIFALETKNVYNSENKYINDFPTKFLLNRTVGGMLSGIEEAVHSGKTRLLK